MSAELPTGAGDAGARAGGRLAGLRVLVVDDDPDIRAAMTLALRAEGAVVETAEDGSVALHQLQHFVPEAVVLDVMLPGQSGFTVLEHCQRAPSRPAVVMVTANQGRRHASFAQSLGAQAYLLKPVPLARLVETVASIAGR
ncbi:MAG: response regulator [Phycisphaerales bacterium]